MATSNNTESRALCNGSKYDSQFDRANREYITAIDTFADLVARLIRVGSHDLVMELAVEIANQAGRHSLPITEAYLESHTIEMRRAWDARLATMRRQDAALFNQSERNV